MADTAARLAISARRNEVARFTIAVTGIDMTGVALAMQIRLGRDVPGAPLIALATVSTLAAEGLKLDGVTIANGVPTSIIKGRINASTMTDATKVPYMGEIGTDSVLAYAMQWTLNGDAQTRLYGDFVVLGSAFNSDNAPSSRPQSYGGALSYSGGSSGGSLSFGDQIIQVSITGVEQVSALIVLAKAEADRAATQAAASNTARVGAEVARGGSETARVMSRGWAEGPVPAGGERSSKGWAQIAQAGAAVADSARVAVEQAISQVPSDTRLLLEAVTVSVLRGVAAETPIGRLAYLAEPGREGVWQLRFGDYSAQVASDTYGTRYVAINSVAASQKSWVRIVAGNLFRFSWTGLNSDVADALPYLLAGCSLFDANARWELPNHRMSLPSSTAKPELFVKEGVALYGFGRSSHLEYTGTNAGFRSIINANARNITVEKMRISGIAQNNSANNPAVIFVGAGAAAPADYIDNVRIREVEYDRTSTGIYVSFYGTGPGSPLQYPSVEISDINGVTNGAAVSLFGASNSTLRDYDLRFDPNLQSNSPAAKKTGVRLLGTSDSHIGRGHIAGYDNGIIFDAAYAGLGSRAVNRNLSVDAVDMTDVYKPYFVFECDGYLRVSSPICRRSIATTDVSRFCEIYGNQPLSALDPADPDPRKTSIVGSVVIENAQIEGYSVGVYQQGLAQHLEIRDMRIVGNKCLSEMTGERGSVFIDQVGGLPKTVTVRNSDFKMAVGDEQPAMLLRSTGVVIATNNMLPETPSGVNGIAVEAPIYFSGGKEQRPYSGRTNLGSNVLYATGTLDSYRDGTAVPAKTIIAAPWTRNRINIGENATNIFTKNGGGAFVYDAAAYSSERFLGDFELVYRLKQVTQDLRVGLISTYRGPGAVAYDYGTRYFDGGTQSTFITYNGVEVQSSGAYSAATIERWRRVGTRLIFSRNDVDLINLSVSSELTLGLQLSIAQLGEAVEILRFGTI